MKKQFKLDEIDCANCARKLQDELAKLDGVKSVSVNFMTQKLTLEADDAEFDARSFSSPGYANLQGRACRGLCSRNYMSECSYIQMGGLNHGSRRSQKEKEEAQEKRVP